MQGLWGGMIAGIGLQTLLLLLVLFRTNWNKEGLQNSRQSKLSSRVIHLQVEQTTERMKKWGGQDISTDKVNDSNI
ncbi:hypothetical protein QQP08_010891 [Theobroma cacao]|nr:hypothetical protein QQP08_010891 [Theobroma cacao]